MCGQGAVMEFLFVVEQADPEIKAFTAHVPAAFEQVNRARHQPEPVRPAPGGAELHDTSQNSERYQEAEEMQQDNDLILGLVSGSGENNSDTTCDRKCVSLCACMFCMWCIHGHSERGRKERQGKGGGAPPPPLSFCPHQLRRTHHLWCVVLSEGALV